ncbi:hypothetical protein CBR_g51792 [Chara braunii]|uniref:Myb/SANT-like DNA-binding domain-containing protein n=1 Tax=Chara braunii TaxID=69332 RepID=A0A388M906_CHABU|nr:hypothetical protein CBR_g51792 [Chara braunii]|eukprot:GBG91058.1 hypothetical protein CBR_g51792 [Chara braunii]
MEGRRVNGERVQLPNHAIEGTSSRDGGSLFMQPSVVLGAYASEDELEVGKAGATNDDEVRSTTSDGAQGGGNRNVVGGQSTDSEGYGKGKLRTKVWDVIANKMIKARWNRTADECKRRWNILRRWYISVVDNDTWSGRQSYWTMTPAERKATGLDFNFRSMWFDILQSYNTRNQAVYPDRVVDPGVEEEVPPPPVNDANVEWGQENGGVQERHAAPGVDVGQSSEVTGVTGVTPGHLPIDEGGM